MATKIFLVIVILSVIYVQNIALKITLPKITEGYSVYIFNELPENSPVLRTHCYSGDDDLGNHTLHENQYHNWHFHVNIFQTTRFSCSFWWDGRHKAFDVFYAKKGQMCQTGLGINVCSWIVLDDGFYFSPSEEHELDMRKMYDWD